MPSAQWKMRTQRQKWYAGETPSVAIGQGALTVTPLQLARAIGGVAVGSYTNAETRAAWAEILRLLDHVQIGFGNPLSETFRKREQEEDHLVLLARVEAADHAEVHQCQAAIVGEQDVAGVRIAVEDAIDGDLLHVRREQILGDALRIVFQEFRTTDLSQVATA